MFRWIIICGCLLLILGILAVVFVVTVTPQGLADILLEMENEIKVYIDGEKHVVRFTEYEGGTDKGDSLFLKQKLQAFYFKSRRDSAVRAASLDFKEALLEAAADETLTAKENRHLREMHRDLIPDAEAERWMDLAFEESKEQEND